MLSASRPLAPAMANAESIVTVSAVSDDPSLQTTSYLHTTTYRGAHMDIQIHSPSVKTIRHDSGLNHVLPMFGDRDRVVGSVTLDPSCCQAGRLFILLEGSFAYATPRLSQPSQGSKKRELTFLTTSRTISVPAIQDHSPRSALHNAFATALRRRPSASSPRSSSQSQVSRSFDFQFELPYGHKPAESLPHSFSSASVIETAPRSRAFVERIEVSYKITATWEANENPEITAKLEAPFILQNVDAQSLDGVIEDPHSWHEMPLSADRPISFQCAATLPSPSVFSRAASIPYYVVFTTKPQSRALRQEIASDATITVTLIRRMRCSVDNPRPSHPRSRTASTDSQSSAFRSADGGSPKPTVKPTSPAPRGVRTSEEIPSLATRNRPLPDIPEDSEPFTESRTLHTTFNLGFPKRPRHRPDPGEELEESSQRSLPDGLFKGVIPLNRSMLPTTVWRGINVEYFLEVSVLVGQEDTRGQIPIRIS